MISSRCSTTAIVMRRAPPTGVVVVCVAALGSVALAGSTVAALEERDAGATVEQSYRARLLRQLPPVSDRAELESRPTDTQRGKQLIDDPVARQKLLVDLVKVGAITPKGDAWDAVVEEYGSEAAVPEDIKARRPDNRLTALAGSVSTEPAPEAMPPQRDAPEVVATETAPPPRLSNTGEPPVERDAEPEPPGVTVGPRKKGGKDWRWLWGVVVAAAILLVPIGVLLGRRHKPPSNTDD